VERLAIIVTNFHGYFSQKLDELNSSRKVPIQWACLSTTLSVEVKSKILEMYELGKLKLLLISPELFENEEYHSF
jgi:superfamily II DNA helicase RecQ